MNRNIHTSHEKSYFANYQDLLKTIALICMLLDHLGLYILPDQIWLRIIGRSVMPIFAFYAGYNFHHKIRHMIWILGALITAAFGIVIGFFVPANMLIGLALGQVYLFYAGKAIVQHPQRFFLHFIMMLALGVISQGITEYGTLAIAFMQVGYLRASGHKDPGYLLLAGLSLAIFHQYSYDFDTIMQFGGALFAVLASVGLLHYIPHNNAIGINLKPISRNMLYIYTITTMGYIFAWGI